MLVFYVYNLMQLGIYWQYLLSELLALCQTFIEAFCRDRKNNFIMQGLFPVL